MIRATFVRMQQELTTIIVGGVAGAISGTFVSVVAPWVNWRIELKRQIRQERVQLVEAWRVGLSAAEAADEVEDNRFLRTPWYSSLRSNLTDSERASLETPPPRTTFVDADGVRRHRTTRLVANAVDRVAKEWEID